MGFPRPRLAARRPTGSAGWRMVFARLPAPGRWAAAAFGALALAALAGEALVRASGALDHGLVPRRLLARGASPGPPYRLRAGERLEVLGREVRVSSLGLRGPEVASRPP